MKVKERFSRIVTPSQLAANRHSQGKVLERRSQILAPGELPLKIHWSSATYLANQTGHWRIAITAYLNLTEQVKKLDLFQKDLDIQRLFQLAEDPRIENTIQLIWRRKALSDRSENKAFQKASSCLDNWSTDISTLDTKKWLRQALGLKVEKYFMFSSRV